MTTELRVPRPRRYVLYREKSETVKELMTALAAASLEFSPIEKDCEERVVRNGKLQIYRYASIKSILKSCKPALSKAGINIVTEYSNSDEGVTQITMLQLGDQYISSVLPIRHNDDLRKQKAEQTLKRRISLEGLLCIAAGDDDDGAAATDDQPAEDGNAFWREQLTRAKKAIADATTAAQVNEVVSKVKSKIDKGEMDPHSIGTVEIAAKDRLSQMEGKKCLATAN